MEGPKSRPSPVPLSPSPTGPSSHEAAALPGGIQSPAASGTPLASRLRGWDRSGATSTPSTSQVLRESPIGQGESPIRGLDDMEVTAWSPLDPDALGARADTQAQPGPRRLNVQGEAEVHDPRIGHLPDDAALSDDEDTVARMPPSPVGGVSPDTGFAVSDPGWDAIFRAMMFNGRSVGLDQAASISLLRERGVMDGLRHALGRELLARGYGDAHKAPDAVLRAGADMATASLLRSRGHAMPQAGDTKATSPQPPSLDELEQRFAALLAKADGKTGRKG